mmetsp:Transcript_157535/g.302314  ORF Transcript_157535/g.302314 Transcript_157535/m.302314 type:complete len:538 (-) Transcript_157535:158-1771(-)
MKSKDMAQDSTCVDGKPYPCFSCLAVNSAMGTVGSSCSACTSQAPKLSGLADEWSIFEEVRRAQAQWPLHARQNSRPQDGKAADSPKEAMHWKASADLQELLSSGFCSWQRCQSISSPCMAGTMKRPSAVCTPQGLKHCQATSPPPRSPDGACPREWSRGEKDVWKSEEAERYQEAMRRLAEAEDMLKRGIGEDGFENGCGLLGLLAESASLGDEASPRNRSPCAQEQWTPIRDRNHTLAETASLSSPVPAEEAIAWQEELSSSPVSCRPVDIGSWQPSSALDSTASLQQIDICREREGTWTTGDWADLSKELQALQEELEKPEEEVLDEQPPASIILEKQQWVPPEPEKLELVEPLGDLDPQLPPLSGDEEETPCDPLQRQLTAGMLRESGAAKGALVLSDLQEVVETYQLRASLPSSERKPAVILQNSEQQAALCEKRAAVPRGLMTCLGGCSVGLAKMNQVPGQMVHFCARGICKCPVIVVSFVISVLLTASEAALDGVFMLVGEEPIEVTLRRGTLSSSSLHSIPEVLEEEDS